MWLKNGIPCLLITDIWLTVNRIFIQWYFLPELTGAKYSLENIHALSDRTHVCFNPYTITLIYHPNTDMLGNTVLYTC